MNAPDQAELRKVLIYIPAYNAAVTLPRVLARIDGNVRQSVGEILVVDNASPDNTNLVAIECREKQNITNLSVIRNEENRGYGGSQKIGYQYAIDHGYAGVAMLHGDAQYAPELLWDLLQPVLKGEADMVFGSRMAGDPRKGGMPLIRYLGNRFLTTMQNIVLGTRLSEFHSGYRVYSVEALKQIPLHRLSSDYHFDTEIIIVMHAMGFRIAEQPIPTHYGDEKNYVNIWKYGMDVLVTTVTFLMWKRGLLKRSKWQAIMRG